MYYPYVTFIAPYRVYVPDEHFKVKTDKGVAYVNAIPVQALDMAGCTQLQGPDVEIRNDIFGFGGRTRFGVALDQAIDNLDPNWKKTVSDNNETIFDIALYAVNRLLSVYREIDVNQIGQKSFHIIELVRVDLSDIHIFVLDENQNPVPNFSHSRPGYQSMGFGSATIRNNAVTDTIRNYLAANTVIPVERELLSSAHNHLWRQQLRLVPIEANTAFESFTLSALRKLKPANIPSDKTSFLYKLVALDNAISNEYTNNSKTFVSWFGNPKDGWISLLSPELKEWHSFCYLLRNKIIHEGYSPSQITEARDALESAINAMEFIEKCIQEASSL